LYWQRSIQASLNLELDSNLALIAFPILTSSFRAEGGSLRRSFDSSAHFNENVWRFDFEAEHRDESGRD